jgi:Tfp pilus assembly protein PilV
MNRKLLVALAALLASACGPIQKAVHAQQTSQALEHALATLRAKPGSSITYGGWTADECLDAWNLASQAARQGSFTLDLSVVKTTNWPVPSVGATLKSCLLNGWNLPPSHTY